MPRVPHSSLNVRRHSPSRVPPLQSSTRSAARRRALSGSWPPSSRVSRVSRVPRANASTRWRPPTAAWTKRSIARAYGSIEPLMSSSRTSRRRRSPGSRQARRIGSPPARSAWRIVRRRSGWAPRRDRLRAEAAPRRAGEAQAGHQLLREAQLVVLVGGEVLVAQHLGGGEAQDELRVAVGLVLAVVVVVVGGVLVVDGQRHPLHLRLDEHAVGASRRCQNTANARS